MKPIIKQVLLVFFASFILWQIIEVWRIPLPIRCIVSFAAYFYGTYYAAKKYSGKLSPLVLLLSIWGGAIVFALPYCLTHLPYHFLTVPGTDVLSIAAGYAFYRSKCRGKIIVIVLSIAYIALYCCFYHQLFDYFKNNYWVL
jgi:hypothetical protein